MPVHIVTDTVNKLSDLRVMLERHHAVTAELLSGASIRCGEFDDVVVTADLQVVNNIATLKEMFGKLTHIHKRIFIIDQKTRLCTVQAYALGATGVLVNQSISPVGRTGR